MLLWGSSARLQIPTHIWCLVLVRSFTVPEVLCSPKRWAIAITDHTKTLRFNSKNSSTQLCWWWCGYMRSAGCSSVSRLLIRMHVSVAPFTSQSFGFCRREIPWYISLKEIAPGPHAGQLGVLGTRHATHPTFRLQLACRTAVATARSHRWLLDLLCLELLGIKMSLNMGE